MSAKNIIQGLCDALLAGVKIFARDTKELERLQNTTATKMDSFANASIKAASLAVVRSLKNLALAYAIHVPKEFESLIKHEVKDDSLGSFILNPISNAKLFTRGFPFVSLSVGMCLPGQKVPHQVAIYDLSTNAIFSATSSQGSFLNSGFAVRIKPSIISQISNSTIIISGLNSSLQFSKGIQTQSFRKKLLLLQNLAVNSGEIIFCTSHELAIAYVAAGKAEACFCVGDIDSMSIASAIVFAKEVDTKTFNLDGDPVNLLENVPMGGFIVSSSSIFQQLQKFITSSN